MNGLTEEQLLLRNLKDAGCGETDIQRFLQLGHEGKQREQLRLLSAHRTALLDQLHVSQRQIDCLDYLVYQMSSRSDKHQGRNMETEA